MHCAKGSSVYTIFYIFNELMDRRYPKRMLYEAKHGKIASMILFAHANTAIKGPITHQCRYFTPFFSNQKERREQSNHCQDGKQIIVENSSKFGVIPLKFDPLSLIEEFIPPPVIPSAIELITSAWTEERAESLRRMKIASIAGFALIASILFSVLYSVIVAGENKMRGRDTMPREMRIGSVVYLDISENGGAPMRITIGLLSHTCPIYCEYFHRKCCGLAKESFRGIKVTSTLPGVGVLFGDVEDTSISVPDFDEGFIPREDFSTYGSWRGAISAIPFTRARQSGNFCIHMGASSHAPQVFAIIIGGYDAVERISKVGAQHGSLPKKEFQVIGCGELCTLDANKVAPIPWDTYSDVSFGFDEKHFGSLNVDLPNHM